MGALSVMVLRYKEPNIHRPFRVPFYPGPPVVVICVAVGIISSSFATTPSYVGMAFCFIALSIPFHVLFFENNTVLHRLPQRVWGAVRGD